jgi:glycerol kinase
MKNQPPLSPNTSLGQSNYFLVLDVGTTGIKALLFDADLALVGRSYRDISKNKPKRGYVEQDAEEFVSTSKKVLQEVLEDSGIASELVTSIGITNQRETIIAWDSETGTPLYPAIVWEDTRTANTCRLLRLLGKNRFVRNRTGLPIDPYFSATKISWLLKNVPAVKEALTANTLKVGTVESWLLWNLSEDKEFKTDYTNAARTLLFNINKLTWDAELLRLFGIPEIILAKPVPSADMHGIFKKSILQGNIPIQALCGDQQASMYAAGTSIHTTKITYGTGAFLVQVIGASPKLHPSFFTTIVPTPNGGITYALEAKVGECGSRITPVLGQPAKLAEVFKAIAKQVSLYTQKLPYKPHQLIADGGAIRNPLMAEFQHEASNIPVREQSIFDGTGLGTAKLLVDYYERGSK